jgi:PTS system nitrogen regulatory IIA component
MADGRSNPPQKSLGSLEIAMQATRSVSAPVGLAEIFPPEAIVIGLVQRTKRGVVEELVHHLVELGNLAEGEEKIVVESVLAREKMGSTALGNGIAFPHCRSSVTERFVGVLGVDPRGIPFDAVDGEPVQSIFLLLAPLDGREKHYEVLGRITAIGKDKGRRVQLRGCRTAEAVHAFLEELDRS